MKLAVVTVFTRNYLAGARTVLQSAAQWLPGAGLIGYLADEPEGCFEPADESFQVIHFDELALPRYRALAFACPPVALCCLLKGFAVRHALTRLGYEAVIYVDCDTLFMGEPRAMLDALKNAPLVLTPHRLTPAGMGVDPAEASLLPFGIFNAGTFGAARSESTLAFLDWWGTRLTEPNSCVLKFGYDQAWLNYAPVYVPQMHVLRSPAWNVAVWNLNERVVDWKPSSGYVVNKQRLELYHFSFFDPGKPQRPFPGDEGWQYTDTSGLARLLCEYAQRLHDSGLSTCRTWGCSWGAFSDGTPVLLKHRDFFQAHYLRGYVEGDDPFDVDSRKFGKGANALSRAHRFENRVMRQIGRVARGGGK